MFFINAIPEGCIECDLAQNQKDEEELTSHFQKPKGPKAKVRLSRLSLVGDAVVGFMDTMRY